MRLARATLNDNQIMTHLIRVAERWVGKTSPNPVVAAAVVQNGVVVGWGVHRRAGGAHAEVAAIRAAAGQCDGATLYVTLEPCTHTGRTPPCVDLIIASGIRRVVYAIDDPNPVVRHRPARVILESAGISVVSGICESAAQTVNRIYFKNRLTQRPYVSLKAAVSLDGRIALENGKSKYITGPESLQRVAKIRARHDAILVGVNTVLMDDPLLSVRLKGRRPIMKPVVILDPHLRTPPESALFKGRTIKEVIVVTSVTPSAQWLARSTVIVQPAPFDLDQLLKQLFVLGITSVLVEGGGRTFTEFLTHKMVDYAHFFVAPVVMGGRAIPVIMPTDGHESLLTLPRLQDVWVHQWGHDVEIAGNL